MDPQMNLKEINDFQLIDKHLSYFDEPFSLMEAVRIFWLLLHRSNNFKSNNPLQEAQYDIIFVSLGPKFIKKVLIIQLEGSIYYSTRDIV